MHNERAHKPFKKMTSQLHIHTYRYICMYSSGDDYSLSVCSIFVHSTIFQNFNFKFLQMIIAIGLDSSYSNTIFRCVPCYVLLVPMWFSIRRTIINKMVKFVYYHWIQFRWYGVCGVWASFPAKVFYIHIVLIVYDSKCRVKENGAMKKGEPKIKKWNRIGGPMIAKKATNTHKSGLIISPILFIAHQARVHNNCCWILFWKWISN